MTSTARAVLAVLHRATHPLTLRDLQHQTGCDRRRLYGATVELEEAGLLRCLTGPRGRRPWRYAADPVDRKEG